MFSVVELRTLVRVGSFRVEGRVYNVKRAPLGVLLACERILWASTSLDANDEALALGVTIQNNLDRYIKSAREWMLAKGKKLPLESGTVFRRSGQPVDIDCLLKGGTLPAKATNMNGRRRCSLFICFCGKEFARRKNSKYAACCRSHSKEIQAGLQSLSVLAGSGWIDKDGNVTVIERSGKIRNG